MSHPHIPSCLNFTLYIIMCGNFHIIEGDRNLLQLRATEAVQRKQATEIFPQVSQILCSAHVRFKTTCTVFMYFFLEVRCKYEQNILNCYQSLWNSSLGVKTMQLSSDRRPVLRVPSYTYGSTDHFRVIQTTLFNPCSTDLQS